MNGFLAWLQSVGHTLKGWVGFMTPDEWIVLGMVIAALALAMTGTSVTRKVKRKRRVRRADTTPPSVGQEKETSEQPESEETVVDAQQEPVQTQKEEEPEQQASQEIADVAENRFEEPATVVEDDNLSVEVGSHSSEMAPALEEITPSSIEEPLSAPTHTSDAPAPTSVEPIDEELIVNKAAEAPELVREEDYPAQEQSQEEEEVPVTEESSSVQEQNQEEERIQAEPEQAAEQSDVDVAEVPPSQPQVTADQEHKPFKPRRRPPAPSIAVSYDANAQKQSRGRGARREDIASLTGGGDPVAAKLNLARVYSDTGDSKEAQQLLQEVLKEGSDAQQRAAKAYLEKLQQREDT